MVKKPLRNMGNIHAFQFKLMDEHYKIRHFT